MLFFHIYPIPSGNQPIPSVGNPRHDLMMKGTKSETLLGRKIYIYIYGKSPFFIGKSSISMAMFNSYFDITRGYFRNPKADVIPKGINRSRVASANLADFPQGRWKKPRKLGGSPTVDAKNLVNSMVYGGYTLWLCQNSY